MDICAASDEEIPANEYGVVAKTIPAGRCAVLRHIGSNDTLPAIAHLLYAERLPQSGEDLRDFPLFFQRVIFFPDVTESKAVTDVFLPLNYLTSGGTLACYDHPVGLWCPGDR